jgi:hypothetical protein
MQESINIEVELRGKTFDIEAEADYEVITSECTSEVGDNPYCTERWEESPHRGYKHTTSGLLD